MKTKTPLYAALGLHSRYSVLGSMDHDGRTQPRMRFPTQAEVLRAQVRALKQKKKRPLYLTMEAATSHRGPWKLIYYEAYPNQEDALGRERYLKSGSGRRFLKAQLRHYLAEGASQKTA